MFACVLFRQFSSLHNVVEELAAIDVLGNKEDMMGCIENLQQLYYICVIQHF